MMRREWSRRAVPDDRSSVRQQRIRRDLARLGFAAVLLVVGFLGTASTSLFTAAEKSIAQRGLVRQSALLQTDLNGLRSLIDTLGSALAGLTSRPDAFRIARGSAVAKDASVSVGTFLIEAPTAAEAGSTSEEVDELLRRARLLAYGWREAGDELKRRYDDLASTPSLLPTSGYIASVFSRSRWHPILGRNRPHLGVDIVAPAGTPVIAAARGRVSFVGRRGEYGNMIEIDHGYGRATRYAHLSRMDVRVGQWVERAQAIGKVGSTGLAVGAHLHYEVLINGRPANPRRFILEGGTTAN
jgi:murein DD-endopeptidase MepM/ murein hydrolase activator NlpD